MGDDAHAGGTFRNRNAPSLRRGLDQHGTAGGTTFAHIVDRGADAATAAGRHVAPGALVGEVHLGCDIFRLDETPVGIELIGDKLRQAGQCALTHLGACDADDRRIIGLDDDPDAKFGARWCLRGGFRDGPTEGQATAGGERGGEEGAAANVE